MDIWYVLPLTANFLTFIVFFHKHNGFFSVDLLREHIYYIFHVFPSHCPLILGFLGLHTGPGMQWQGPILGMPTALQDLGHPSQC